MAWTITTEPVGKNPGVFEKVVKETGVARQTPENMGGVVIYLVNGSTKQEVSRVAYIRRASKNPKVKFKDQLNTELDKAREALGVLNAKVDESGVLR